MFKRNNAFVGRCRQRLEALFSLTLITGCLFNIALSPYCMCAMESCHEKVAEVLVQVNTVLPRTLAVVCLVSRAKTMLHSASGAFSEYEKRTRKYKTCFPDGAGSAFVAFVVSVYAVTALPTNAYRLYMIHRDVGDRTVTVFFVLMYAQNLCTCSSEIHYVARCYGLYRRFCRINEDVSALKSATVVANRYPTALLFQPSASHVSPPAAVTRPTADSVELLRMRHQCVRDAVGDLNDLYGVQLLLSLCVLCVMTVVDSYGEIFGVYTLAQSQVFLYAWLVHYLFRFCTIVLTTHFTMKQAYRTKSLTTDINNRHLDISTKEELYLFSNQIICHSMEFTTCDFFTLNAHFITSTIAAVTTYFIILLQ
ncbi:uncharacterized protein LOC112599894, partial [Melanaphis sacchari]|uniref:uncharacterized protein LOC112599894 n=1 Tax=Melanaphis sacchari TaxID=742174 RepID=UPI000DC137EE